MSDWEFPARFNLHIAVRLAISTKIIQPATEVLNNVKEYSSKINLGNFYEILPDCLKVTRIVK